MRENRYDKLRSQERPYQYKSDVAKRMQRRMQAENENQNLGRKNNITVFFSLILILIAMLMTIIPIKQKAGEQNEIQVSTESAERKN